MRIRKKGTLWIVTGCMLLAAALALSLYNIDQSNSAYTQATRVARELVPMIRELETDASTTDPTAVQAHEAYPDMEMPTLEVDGKRYLGYIEIPDLDIVLPISGDPWSYEALKSTPCRFTGSAYRDNMVLAAHNYASHFGRLSTLPRGAEIRFVDAAGNVFTYTIAWTEIIEPSDVEGMTQGEDWDLTLFTCTYGGQTRYTVRCIRKEA